MPHYRNSVKELSARSLSDEEASSTGSSDQRWTMPDVSTTSNRQSQYDNFFRSTIGNKSRVAVDEIKLKPVDWFGGEQNDRITTVRGSAARFAGSLFFETMMGLLIIVNCLTIGMETAPDFFGRTTLDVAEHIFTAIFLVEVILRVYVEGRSWFFAVWNLFDLGLVLVCGVLVMWVLKPLVAAGILNNRLGFTRHFQLLRVFRLMRVARVVRFVPAFKEMWLLLCGVAQSMKTLFWTVVVILFALYVFAILSFLIMEANDEFHNSSDSDHFRTLPWIMLTLFRIMTLDGWFKVVVPILSHDYTMIVVFVPFMCLSVFVLLNLVTAVIVNNALEVTKNDEKTILRRKNEELVHCIDSLKKLFHELDENGDQILSREEFACAFQNPAIMNKLHLLGFEESDISDLYDLMDDRQSGEISIDDFCYGLRHMQGDAKAKDLVMVVLGITRCFQKIQHLRTTQNETQAMLRTILEECRSLRRIVTTEHKEKRIICESDSASESNSPSIAEVIKTPSGIVLVPPRTRERSAVPSTASSSNESSSTVSVGIDRSTIANEDKWESGLMFNDRIPPGTRGGSSNLIKLRSADAERYPAARGDSNFDEIAQSANVNILEPAPETGAAEIRRMPKSDSRQDITPSSIVSNDANPTYDRMTSADITPSSIVSNNANPTYDRMPSADITPSSIVSNDANPTYDWMPDADITPSSIASDDARCHAQSDAGNYHATFDRMPDVDITPLSIASYPVLTSPLYPDIYPHQNMPSTHSPHQNMPSTHSPHQNMPRTRSPHQNMPRTHSPHQNMPRTRSPHQNMHRTRRLHQTAPDARVRRAPSNASAAFVQDMLDSHRNGENQRVQSPNRERRQRGHRISPKYAM